MSIVTLIIAALITAFLFGLLQQGYLKQPFNWLVIALIFIMWLVVLAQLLGFGGVWVGRVG